MEILSGTELFTNESSLTRKIIDLCGLFTRIFPITVITLFCLIALIISMQLRSISSRLKTDQTSIEEKHLTLLKWQHILVYRAVEKMNHNFGFALLFEAVFTFVAITNNLMFILASASKRDWHMTVSCSTFCVDQILQLFVVSMAADRILNEVMNLNWYMSNQMYNNYLFSIESQYLYRLVGTFAP